eukprot:g2435.t1
MGTREVQIDTAKKRMKEIHGHVKTLKGLLSEYIRRTQKWHASGHGVVDFLSIAFTEESPVFKSVSGLRNGHEFLVSNLEEKLLETWKTIVLDPLDAWLESFKEANDVVKDYHAGLKSKNHYIAKVNKIKANVSRGKAKIEYLRKNEAKLEGAMAEYDRLERKTLTFLGAFLAKCEKNYNTLTARVAQFQMQVAQSYNSTCLNFGPLATQMLTAEVTPESTQAFGRTRLSIVMASKGVASDIEEAKKAASQAVPTGKPKTPVRPSGKSSSVVADDEDRNEVAKAQVEETKMKKKKKNEGKKTKKTRKPFFGRKKTDNSQQEQEKEIPRRQTGDVADADVGWGDAPKSRQGNGDVGLGHDPNPTMNFGGSNADADDGWGFDNSGDAFSSDPFGESVTKKTASKVAGKNSIDDTFGDDGWGEQGGSGAPVFTDDAFGNWENSGATGEANLTKNDSNDLWGNDDAFSATAGGKGSGQGLQQEEMNKRISTFSSADSTDGWGVPAAFADVPSHVQTNPSRQTAKNTSSKAAKDSGNPFMDFF